MTLKNMATAIEISQVYFQDWNSIDTEDKFTSELFTTTEKIFNVCDFYSQKHIWS